VTGKNLDVRWLAGAVAAAVICAATFVAASVNVPASSLHQVLTALSWMAAIITLACAVRGGIDAGVHRGAEHRTAHRS